MSALLAGPCSIIHLGEVHEQADVVRFQIAALDCLLRARPPALHLVLEHFTFKESTSLQTWFSGSAPPVGETEEGFRAIFPVLQYARDFAGAVPVRVYAGFPTREQARGFARRTEGEVEGAWGEGEAGGWLPRGRRDLLHGCDSHYAFFEALLQSKEETEGADWRAPNGAARGIFPAQVVKDCAMAAAVARAHCDLPGHDGASEDEEAHEEDEEAGGRRDGESRRGGTASARRGIVVTISGAGHCDFGFGVPERVAALLGLPSPVPGQAPPRPAHRSLVRQHIITVRPRAQGTDDGGPPPLPPATVLFPDGTTRVAGDVVYTYTHEEEEEEEEEGQEEGQEA